MASKNGLFHAGLNYYLNRSEYSASISVTAATQNHEPRFKDPARTVWRRPIKQHSNKICVGASFQKGRTSSTALQARAIVDTGAQGICLRQSICKALKLPRIGRAMSYGANAGAEVDIYQGHLSLFMGAVSFGPVHIVGLTMPSSTDALIGWPIISQAVLTVDRGRGFIFDFTPNKGG